MGVFKIIKRIFKISCAILAISLLLYACSNNNENSNSANIDIIEEEKATKITESVEQDKALNNEEGILILKDVNLIDGTGEPLRANTYILIEEGKIKAIGTQAEVKIPSEAIVVDLKGATALPGFINAHVHQAYNEENLQNWLNAGVTTVRCLGPGMEEDFIEIRDELNLNLNNAFIVSATPILKVKNGYGYGNAVVSSPEDAKSKVLDYIDSGVDIIKFSIEDNLPPGNNCELIPDDVIKSIVDAAHSKNIKVSVHISSTKYLKKAIDAGVDDVAHMVVDNLDTDTINDMINKNIYFEPTLELWNGVGWGSIAVSNLSKFYKAGGKIAFGTDFAGYTTPFDKEFPITEVKLMKDAGMSNMDIIVAATKNAAYVCGMDKEIGTVEIGKKADLLIVDGDPLEDIYVLNNAKIVIHSGIIIKND